MERKVWSHYCKDSNKSGRWFLHFGNNKCFIFEWNVFTSNCHVKFSIDNGELNISFACFLFAVYLGLEHFKAFHLPNYEEREISVSIHHGSIWWNFWTPSISWGSKTPKWRNGSFSFSDFFFGKSKYSSMVVEEKEVLIPMPEGNYLANIKLCEDTWTRKFGRKIIKRIHCDIPKGIPHSGKGENSYDCGEDACFGMTCLASNIADGVGKIVGSVLNDRVRYGGWKEWNYPKNDRCLNTKD